MVASIVAILKGMIKTHSTLQQYIACKFEKEFFNDLVSYISASFGKCQSALQHLTLTKVVSMLELITNISVKRMARRLEGNTGQCSGGESVMWRESICGASMCGFSKI
jgi:hypothetical protein